MDQCFSTSRLNNIIDQAFAALIALGIWKLGKFLLFRYRKPKQDDKKSHCDVFSQKLQDIQNDQTTQGTQQDKKLKDISLLLNKVRQEQLSKTKQIDDHHHHNTSPDLSHPQRSPTATSASFGGRLDIASNRQVWDLRESITAEIPPGATHARLGWIFSPRTSPVLEQAQAVEHDGASLGRRRVRHNASLIEGEMVAGPSSRANITRRSAEGHSGGPADLGITMSDEELLDDPEEDPEESSSEADESGQSSNQIPPVPSVSPTVPGSSNTQPSGSNWATGMGLGRAMSRSQKR